MTNEAESVIAPTAKKTPARKTLAKTAPVKTAPVKRAAAKKAAVKAVPVKTAAAPVAVAPKPVSQVATKPAKKKAPKLKIVRDSFTMPEADFVLIDRVKQRALEWRMPVKKSEVLRAALQALQGLNDAQLKKVLSGLAPIKKGRPKGE